MSRFGIHAFFCLAFHVMDLIPGAERPRNLKIPREFPECRTQKKPLLARCKQGFERVGSTGLEPVTSTMSR